MKKYPEVPVSAVRTKNSKWYRLLCADAVFLVGPGSFAEINLCTSSNQVFTGVHIKCNQ
jgi:hypothetical protein